MIYFLFLVFKETDQTKLCVNKVRNKYSILPLILMIKNSQFFDSSKIAG